MADVVLDETEWVQAILADKGAGDIEAARLLACVQIRHRWVLTAAIAAKYRSQYKRRIRGPGNAIALEMIRSLAEVLADSTRCLRPENEPPPEIEDGYHRKDKHIVCAAAWAQGSVVVTSDARLTDQLVKGGLPAKYGFRVIGRALALSELCPAMPRGSQ